MVLGLGAAAANVREKKQFFVFLEALNIQSKTRIKADKGYKSQKNDEILKMKNFKNGIMRKKLKGKQFSIWEEKFNKRISKTRYCIACIFGSIKSWFKTGRGCYRGLNKMHAHHILEGMNYNL